MDWAAGRSAALLAALGVAAVLHACVTGADDTGDGGLDASAVLADVGPKVVLPALEELRATANDLQAASDAWQAAADGDGDVATAKAAAIDAWTQTMHQAQQLELLQVGPAGSALTAVAGQDLRDELYSWPTTNPCRVDQVTADASFAEADFFLANLVNAYGLDTLEHLLHAGADNVCPGQLPLNADGTWDALGADGVEARRAAYAAVVSGGVVDDVDRLIAAWSPDGDDFSGQLADAGGNSSPYSSQQQALNALFDALFYLETETKDAKLGIPAGIIECTDATCPDGFELEASGASSDALAANLQGFRALFDGGDGQGFDDLLAELGHADLVTQMHDALDAADASVTAIPHPLAGHAADPAVGVAYDDIKVVTDLLKGDIATVLTLQIPSEAAGDND